MNLRYGGRPLLLKEHPELEKRLVTRELEVLSHLQKAAKAQGIDFYIFLIPFKVQCLKSDLLDKDKYDYQKPNRILREFSAKNKIPCLDFLELYDQMDPRTIRTFYYHKDMHWTKAGHHHAGEALSKFLAEQDPQIFFHKEAPTMKHILYCLLVMFCNGPTSRKKTKYPNDRHRRPERLDRLHGGTPLVKTPHIDALAKRGTAFTNAHCQSPLCNPSRTSLMTGLRPGTTGIYGLAPWIRQVPEFKDVVTLPQYLKKHGDYTSYTTGKIYHGGNGRRKTDKEFDVIGPPANGRPFPSKKLVTTPFGNHPLVDWGLFPHKDEDKGDWKVAEWAVDQLNQKPKEPFSCPLASSCRTCLASLPRNGSTCTRITTPYSQKSFARPQ